MERRKEGRKEGGREGRKKADHYHGSGRLVALLVGRTRWVPWYAGNPGKRRLEDRSPRSGATGAFKMDGIKIHLAQCKCNPLAVFVGKDDA